MKAYLDKMFPHKLKMRRVTEMGNADYEYAEAFETMCSAQLKSIESGMDNARYTIVCPYIDPKKWEGDRQWFFAELTILGKTLTKGRILYVDNTQIYTVGGVQMGCTIDVLFPTQNLL